MATRLHKDWIIAPALDLELKQYILLGYLQQIKARFAEHKLYPHLEELREHLAHLAGLKRSKEELDASLQRPLLGFDLPSGQAVHGPVEQGNWPEVVDEVIDFALPELRNVLGSGTELRDDLVGRIHFEPVGVLPLDAREGYLLLREGHEARAYAYQVSLLHHAHELLHYPSVYTRYITSYTVGLTCHYGTIKADLIGHQRGLPNPAMFVFEADLPIPRVETFMPLAKQLVLGHVTPAGATGL